MSAATLEDFVGARGARSERSLFILSKVITLGWGLFAVVFSFQVERIAPTVLEAINKIGSMANGPLLALFVLALAAPAVGQGRAVVAFFAGLLGNAALWYFAPNVSWLWWNVSGFVVSLAVALSLSPASLSPIAATVGPLPRKSATALIAMAVLILAVCFGFSALD